MCSSDLFKKAIILSIGFIYLTRDNTDFSFIEIALYVVPMFIDNGATLLNALGIKFIIWLDKSIKLLNIIIVIGCFAGVSGYLLDVQDYFIVNSQALLISGFSISKEVVSIILFVNILEVIVLAIFVPGKDDADVFKKVENIKNGNHFSKKAAKKQLGEELKESKGV